MTIDDRLSYPLGPDELGGPAGFGGPAGLRGLAGLDGPAGFGGPAGPVNPAFPAGPARARLAAALAGWDPGRHGVRALAVFAAVVAVVAAVLAWRARPDVDVLSPASLPASAPVAASADGLIVVAVSGKVRQPGLVRLPAGARVADAIDAAGGALPGTDLSLVNLARPVADGELVIVGLPAPSGPAGSGAAGQASSGPVNLNTATPEQLQQLPGIGPVLAQRIIDYRQQHGGFASVDDLRRVSGIGDARFAELKDRVTV